jgi:hypothetical protein
MSINIMDLVKGAVTDQVMGQIGGMLGQNDRQKTSSVFESATASILGGLLKKSQSPQGAQDIFGAAQQADDSILDKLGDLLGGGDQTVGLQNQGSGILDMVFGNQQSGIIGTLSRVLGFDKTLIGKLLTMAAPILMGVISRQMKSGSMDVAGLTSMLSDQKQHLGDYLPQGMGSELGLGDLTGNSTPTPSSQPRTAAPQASAPSGGGSLAKILIPLLLLGALAYAVFQFAGKQDGGANEAIQEGADAPEIVIDGVDGDFDLDGAAPSMDLDFGGIDFDAIGGEAGEKLKGLQGQFTGIADGFKGLTDETGANALKDKLEGLSGSVGDMGLSDMSGIAKTSASTMVGKFVELVQGFVDNVENPALKGIIQPAVNALLEKLNSLGL